MTRYESVLDHLATNRHRWLVTGVAGFIGSHLLETLLRHGQTVVGLDNFSTGFRHNLDAVRAAVGEAAWAGFELIEGDIRDPDTCTRACTGVDYVLHQAALGSVPRSVEDPATTHAHNATAFLHMLNAARAAGVRRFVYASSSSVYGDHPALPKVESAVGRPLSPYAVTKYTDELYAGAFALNYGLRCIGLRYFNIFGPRQDPNGAYAAVVPKWFDALKRGEALYINGDGETSRDFCYIANCVQANLLSAMAETEEATDQAYNVAFGERTSLNQLFVMIRERAARVRPDAIHQEPVYRAFRAGDVRHSLADIGKAERLLGYAPAVSIAQGLDLAAEWYLAQS